jgi:hypothetical protein
VIAEVQTYNRDDQIYDRGNQIFGAERPRGIYAERTDYAPSGKRGEKVLEALFLIDPAFSEVLRQSFNIPKVHRSSLEPQSGDLAGIPAPLPSPRTPIRGPGNERRKDLKNMIQAFSTKRRRFFFAACRFNHEN